MAASDRFHWVLILLLPVALVSGACTSRHVLRHPDTGKTVVCGPYLKVCDNPWAEACRHDYLEWRCVGDAQRRGFLWEDSPHPRESSRESRQVAEKLAEDIRLAHAATLEKATAGLKHPDVVVSLLDLRAKRLEAQGKDLRVESVIRMAYILAEFYRPRQILNAGELYLRALKLSAMALGPLHPVTQTINGRMLAPYDRPLRSPGEGYQVRFGILKATANGRYEIDVETTKIPLRTRDTGFRVGVVIDNPSGDEFEWYHVSHLPARPKEWTGLQALTPTMARGLTRLTNSRRPFAAFGFDAGDPIGQYRLEVYINGVRAYDVTFDVVEP